MKKIFLTLLVFVGIAASAQVKIGNNVTTIDPTSLLELESTTQGFTPPRMSTAQRDAIVNPANGLLIFNSTIGCYEFYNSLESSWKSSCGDIAAEVTEFTALCNTLSINGTYTAGIELDATNFIKLTVDVTIIGPYTIIANAGGMYFTASGTFTVTGEQQITLDAQGSPANVGNNYLSFKIGKTTCSAVVSVLNGMATVTSACYAVVPADFTPTTISVGQTYNAGDLKVIIRNITYTGGPIYGMSVETENGLTLSSPLQGTLIPSIADLELDVTGTPLLPGNTTLTYSINGKVPACTLTIPVVSGTGFASATSCGALAGTYQAGTGMTGSNTKIVTLTVTTAGTFNIRTDTQNGVYFVGSGIAVSAPSSLNITLTGVGTPLSSGLFNYAYVVSKTATTFTNTTCTSFPVTFTNPIVFPVFDLCAAYGGSLTYIKAPNADANDQFGGNWTNIPTSPDDGLERSVIPYRFERNVLSGSGNCVKMSSDGLTLVVGAPFEQGNGIGGQSNNSMAKAGAAYVYTRASTAATFTFQSYLKAASPTATDIFGGSVDISNNGDTIIIGAHLEDGNGTGVNPAVTETSANSGAAFVFNRTAGVWSQVAYLKANNTEKSDYFGWNVAVSGNGNTFAVGALYEDGKSPGINGSDNNLAVSAGAAYIYSRTSFGAVPTFHSRIKSANIEAADYFGASVDLNDDGTTLAVGAIGEDGSGIGVNPIVNNKSTTVAGAAYVFVFNGTVWSQQAYIKANETITGGAITGWDVSLSGNGDKLAVATPREMITVASSGACFLYIRTGSTWTTGQKLKADIPTANNYFGNSVNFSNDGTTVAVGESYNDVSVSAVAPCPSPTTALADSGSVYLFRYFSGTGTYIQSDKLKMRKETVATAGASAKDHVGWSVGLSGDGKSCAAGAPLEDGNSLTINGTINDLKSNSGCVLVWTAP